MGASQNPRREFVEFSFGRLKIKLGNLNSLPLIVGYAICSSLLAIINKYAIGVFPLPSVLTTLQYVSCVLVVLVLGSTRALQHDPLNFRMMAKFLPAACVFYMAIFTNTSLLKYANVDTFIVFRSSTPILVAVADTLFRKQPWPSRSTFAALFVILFGAVGYALTDRQFNVRAYSWAFAYLFTITFEMVYIKHVVSSIGLNTWGFVLYNNFLSLLLSPLFWYLTGDYRGLSLSTIQQWLNPGVAIPVGLSCIFGLAISFFGFACRRAISATAFTVVGVTNKLLTVIINILIWEKHASAFGIFCLLITIVGGVIYQQSCVGSTKKAGPTETAADEEKGRPLPLQAQKFANGRNSFTSLASSDEVHSPSVRTHREEEKRE
eukprot:TRINITY_DN3706_c0_g1_i2.p1 TRINITY_DN3706_c0_g1~~TRINITY_DN3706_c0_g1_i2.p1  ORF type:complete len:378 (-),score=1.29 TRINITY_DN3706_c0_g1_i2:561-1694(-)